VLCRYLLTGTQQFSNVLFGITNRSYYDLLGSVSLATQQLLPFCLLIYGTFVMIAAVLYVILNISPTADATLSL
jgi:hypothetical protein